MTRRITRFVGLAVGALVATTVLAAAMPAQAAMVFFDDFSDGVADGWTTSSGSWTVGSEDGNLAFQQSDGSADARAIANNVGRGTTLGTITTARAKLRGTGGSVAVLFNALDANNYAFAALRAGRLEVGRRQNGALTVLASAAYTPAPGSWQTFNITGGSGLQTQVDTQPPTAPGLPVVRNITSNGFTMSWPASTDNVGVVGYDVTTVVPPGAGAPIRIWRTSTSSITITDLPARSQNTFEVRAFDAAGNRSAPSPQVVVTTSPPDDQTSPTAPGTPVVSAITSSGFTLSSAPSTDNVAVTAYYVRTPNGIVAYGAFPTTTATLTGLAANTAYTVVVVATDAAGNISPPSGSVTVTTLPAGTCQVSYRIVSRWSGGFQAEITIRNTGAATIGGWALQWTFRSGEAISSVWNVSAVTTSGPNVNVRDAGWNGNIPPGGSVSFGLTGTGVPESPTFVLNGTACVTI